MNNIKCSRCRCVQGEQYFGLKKNGTRYKCCLDCRNRYVCNKCGHTSISKKKAEDHQKKTHVEIKRTRFIKVSDVSALVGMNKYKTIDDVRQQRQPKKEKTIIEKKTEEAKETMTCDDDTNEIIKEIVKEEKDEEVIKRVRSEIYKQNGIIAEETVYDWLKKNGREVTDQQKSNRLEFIIGDTKWIVCGKIDGVIDGGILEIKNRQNRIFHSVPQYERVQVQMYMHMYEYETATLIQQFHGVYSETVMNYNETFIKTVMNKLKKAVISL